MDRACFICGNQAIANQFSDKIAYNVSCHTCGRYNITEEAADDMPSFIKNKHYILSGLTREATSRGNYLNIDSKNYEEIIDSAIVPNNPMEAIDRIILYLVKEEKTYNAVVLLDPLYYPIAYAKNEEEFIYLCKRASELGYLKDFNENKYRLEIKGWDRYNEIKNSKFNSNNVFVAMWFDKSTKILRNTIKESILKAGYDHIIVDESDFTGNIMDYVLGSINQSKFLIADFTTLPEEVERDNQGNEIGKTKAGVRGGVYYETGFAKGIGLEIIHLCKDDPLSTSRLHFDIAQENTIFWNDLDIKSSHVRYLKDRGNTFSPVNLAEKIYDRIIRIFGMGLNK